MNEIFTFIFESLRDLFNFLDFSLPGISLTFMDFLLLVIIIPVILNLVKGAVGESGDGLLFGAMDSFSSSVTSYSNLSYKNYENNRERRDKHEKEYNRFHKQDLYYTNKKRNRKYLKRGGVYDS